MIAYLVQIDEGLRCVVFQQENTHKCVSFYLQEARLSILLVSVVRVVNLFGVLNKL